MAESDNKSGSVSAAARTLGKKGGAKGGNARARSLTKAQRAKIAKMGAEAKHRKHNKS